jgi:hypothetical protein
MPLAFTLLAKACLSKSVAERPAFEFIRTALGELHYEVAQGQYVTNAGHAQTLV